MNVDQFWSIIERVRIASPEELKVENQRLANELQGLDVDELRSFLQHYGDCYVQTYSHELWDAAAIIGGGCSDDSFAYFRLYLMSLGRKAFETALRNPDDLADLEVGQEWGYYLNYLNVPLLRGIELPEGEKHPKQPSGKSVKPWEMSKHFPKLAAKYGYKDSDWLDQKEREEKQARDEEAGAMIKQILLDGGIVTSSGKIPPFKIAAQVLKGGKSPKSDAPRMSWQPIDVKEGHYWIAVSQLEKGLPAEHAARPDLRGVKLTLDVEAGEVDDFAGWMESLKGRA